MSEKIIEKIGAGKYSRKELENLYSKAERLGQVEIFAAAKDALKEVDSRSYSRRFVKPIKDKVQEITQEIADSNNWAKWEDNKVGNGVKPGGSMLNGKNLAEFYISYRHPSWRRALNLVVFQHDENSSVLYRVKAHDGEEVTVETSEKAIELFSNAIKTI